MPDLQHTASRATRATQHWIGMTVRRPKSMIPVELVLIAV